MSKVIGIDISKKTFDVSFQVDNHWKHVVLSNDLKGFRKLKKLLDPADHCLMEASGPYYLQLAMFLYDQGFKVSVINPLVIKRFTQMRLLRTKTDKKDAQAIAEYGLREYAELWKPDEKQILHMRQMFTTIQSIDKQLNMSSKQLHAFQSSGVLCPKVKSTLKSMIKMLETKKEKLLHEMFEQAKLHYSQTFERLQTIPGIGPKTAVLLTLITNNFQKFEHSRHIGRRDD